MTDIEMMSDLLIGLIHGPQGGSARIIDEYYEQFEQFDDEFPEQPRVKRVFIKTLDQIQELFPDIAEAPRWGNKADFYSLFVALGTLARDHERVKSPPMIAKALNDFAAEVDRCIDSPGRKGPAQTYARAITKGSNDRARRVDRHEILLTLLHQYFKKR